MLRKIKVVWQVEDGYVGKDRPHASYLSENDLGMDWEEYDALTPDQQTEAIHEAIREIFEQTITFCIDHVEEVDR